MSNMCLVATPSIVKLADKIRQEYPEAVQRNGFNDQMCTEWVGLYNSTNSKSPDHVPSMSTLISFIEKLRSREGKSFLQDVNVNERQAAIEQEMQEIKAKAIADGTFMKAPNGKPTNLNERQWLQVRTKAFKRWFGNWEKVAKLAASFVNNNNTLTIKENEYTDEFRRIQEESRALSSEEVQLYHKGDRKYSDESRRALGAAYTRLLSRRSGNVSSFRSLTGKGNTFSISRVNGSLFHDIFEINRNYLPNGELVDLHDTYDGCKCFISNDGLCGFAIEPDGNIVSVFSLNPSNKSGFLYAIKDFIREEGGTHLDAYASNKQNLEVIYGKTLGFHVASEMDYNMEYDHDNIAENHGSPKVVFMVNQEVTRKSFDKDSYDEAANYAKFNVKALDDSVSKVEEQLALVFERIPELSKIGSIREYAAYLADKFPNSVDRSIYWHGTNEDLSEGFKSAKKGKGSGAPETQLRNDFYLAKQAWTVLQYVNGVNRNSVDKNGFAHWNKLWWELKEIMSNGRRENNNWKDIVIGEETVRQEIPNKKGIFNRDKGGENGKWLSERKADYGYENKSDKEFFEDILGIQWGKDTFNTWTKRNAEAFKALEKTQKGIYPAIINTQNPIREKGQNTYYEEQRGLFTQAEREGNDAILGEHTDNEFGSDVAVVLNASEKNVHFLGTKEDIEGFKKWLEENRASKVVDENGEPLVVYTGVPVKGLTEFSLETENRSSLTDILKKGIYFSSNRKVAEEYIIGKPIYKTTDKVNEQQAEKINTLYWSGELGIEDFTSEYVGLPNDVINEYVNNNTNEVTGELDVVSFPKGEVISAFLNIKNPTIVKHNGSTIAHLSKENRDAINNNNEGAIIENVNERTNYTGEANFDLIGTDYIVFNPNQIKSATGNNGEFSNENNSILASPEALTLAIEGSQDLTIYEDIPAELTESMVREQEEREARDRQPSSDPDLDKKFGNHDEITVAEILDNLLASDTPFKGFIQALQKNLGDLGSIKIKLVPNSHASVYGIAGVYSALENTIYINRNANYKGKGGKVDATILHEIVHAIVANSLNTAKHRSELENIFNEAREKLFKKYNVSSFEELPEYLRKGRLYGLQNLDEFAAEFFVNGEFVLELNDENTFGKKSEEGSIISKLVNWIKSLLPKGVTDIYKQTGEILEDILLNSGGTIQDTRNLFGNEEGAANAQNIQNIRLSTPDSPLQVYSDGSDIKGTGAIGYGAVFEYAGRQYGISGTEANEEVKKLQQQFPEAKFSNPTMEMLALATVLEHFANMGNGESITINQDYKGAVNYAGLWEHSEGSAQRDGKAWKAKEPYIAHLVDRAKAAIEKIEKDGGSVKINWVKGHQKAGTEQARMNDAADSYAKNRDNSNNIDDAYRRHQSNEQPKSTSSTIDSRYKQGIETIADYYKEGSNGFPGIPNRIHNKLKDHFTKGTELTDDDYKEMQEYINVVSQTSPEYGTILKAEPIKGMPASSGNKQQAQQKQPHIAKTVQDRVTFTESSSSDYPQRTKENADWSDITIDFTESDKGSGGNNELTKRVAGTKYIHFKLHSSRENAYDAQEILDAIKAAGLPIKDIKLNIAGSEISKLNGDQAAYNNEITRLIKGLLDLGVTISEIRSGGQTGIDEAGIIAAKRLGITASVHAPKGWRFRPADGKEVWDKEAFMERFLENRSDVQGDTSYSYRERTPVPEGAEYNPYAGRKISRPKSDAFDTALKATTSRIGDFYNTFTPQQIKDRGTMLADWFSDIIDDYLSNEFDRIADELADPDVPEAQKEQSRALLNLLRDPVNGRQFAAKKLQIKRIAEELKRRVKRNAQNQTGKQKQLWENTLEYFDELFENQASLEIEEQEGIRIIGLQTADVSLDESINDAINDGNDETGHSTASGNDGWLFQARFEDPSRSLSKSVRRMLYNIERGPEDKDDLGHQRKYPSGQIYATLLSYLAKNMQNADDFMYIIGKDEYADDTIPGFSKEDLEIQYPEGYPVFPVLEKMRGQYPWVEQVIERLTHDWLDEDWNSDTAYPSTFGAMASQFYTNFRKAFIPYAKIQVGDGKFGITPLNIEMAERCQKDKLTANYNNGLTLTDLSIYNQDLTINREHARELVRKTSDMLRKNFPAELYSLHQDITSGVEVDKEDSAEYETMIRDLIYTMESFGVSANKDGIIALINAEDNGLAISGILKDLNHIAKSIEKLDDKRAAQFDYLQELTYPSGEPMWKNFFKDRGFISDESYMQSFYDSASKKTRYSYSADNYLQKTFRGLYNKNLEERRKFMDERFKKYEWFYNHSTNTWRNKWLEILYNEENPVEVLPYRNINNITEEKKNFFGEKTSNVRDYANWRPTDIWMVQNRSYEGNKSYSYYLAPIFSDSPMSMTVRGPVLSEEDALDAIIDTLDQELWRIKYVSEDRAKAIKEGKVEPIANLDTGKKGKKPRGKEFCFIPELNNYVLPSTGETILEALTRMKKNLDVDGKTPKIYSAEEIYAVKKNAVQDIMEQKALEYAKENEGMYPHDREGRLELPADFMKSYLNMVYANIAIIQLTTVDLAFYSTNVDFGKRFKETYAGGIELNTNSRYGMKYENTLILKDDKITSPSYETIARIIDSSKNISEKDKERIKDVFKDVNIADAQAIRSMYSFRSILDMMGKWDKRMENALNNFRTNNWQREDFDIIFQTIKPFMYTIAEKNDGIGGVIPVPIQHKNSEVCALMMYDLITNNLDSPVYSALSEFMDEESGADGKPLIHMAQFESAVKVGNQGVIDIRFNAERLMKALNKEWTSKDKKDEDIRGIIDSIYWDRMQANTLDNAGNNYDAVKKQLDRMLDNHLYNRGPEEDRISQAEYRKIMEYLRPTKDEIKDILRQKAIVVSENGTKTINPERVHTTSMENYYQSQPTPAHHIDAEAVFGSQGRNIAPADLPDDFVMTLTDKDGKKLTLKGKEIVDFYYELLNENLIEDFFYKKNGKEDASLKGIFESKEAFRKAVENIVRGNPKYGKDFADALKKDSDGNYVLSPNSPTMFTLMQEIVTSLFKNHITKQKINGAALIQAAGIGLDEDLRLVEDEITGKIIGAQCKMPLTSKEFFEPFMEERIINNKKVMVLDPNKLREAGLDKAVGYRIPTENTSSMLPLIITGFTPQQNGSMIILPAEITALAGSDFDVDKMFIMLSEFYLERYDRDKAWEKFGDIVEPESEYALRRAAAFAKALEENVATDSLDDEYGKDYKDWKKKQFRIWFEAHKDEYELKKPVVKRVEYDFSKSPKDNGRRARNNLVIQMIFSMITEGKNDSLLNPQGFDNFKGAAKLNRILEDPILREKLLENYASAEAGTTETVPSAAQIRKIFIDHYKHWPKNEREKLERTINNYPDEIIVGMYVETLKMNNSEGNKDVIDVLLNSTTKEREDFVADNSAPESPIYPQTFAHSHARNMAGMNQIGIGALQGSMSAKYQRVKVQMRESQQFQIERTGEDGKPKIVTISEVDVSDGGRTLKNCTEIIGACADNGKDPNLADAGSTTDTLPILDYMLRCGLSHEEAVLILNCPAMKMGSYSSAMMRELGYDKSPLGVISKKMLAQAKMNPYSVSAIDQMSMEAVCYRIMCQVEAMEPLTKISRADSPNGAMQNSFAKARIQQYMVDLFNAKMGQSNFPFKRIQGVLDNTSIDVSKGEDAVREALKKQPMALLHGFYALGINSINELGGKQFFMLNKKFDDLVVKPLLYNQHEYTSQSDLEELVDNIYLQYITFRLSASPLFGDEVNADGTTVSMKEKRDYYLNSFARDFTTVINKYPEIRNLLGAVLQRDGNRVVLKDVGSLGKRQKEVVSRRFDALFTIGEEGSELRKAGRDLAKDLLLFAYFDSGLNFGHDSYSTRLSTYFLTQFDEYVNILRLLDVPLDPEQDKEIIERFHQQFLITNRKAAHFILDFTANQNMVNGKIVVDMNDFNRSKDFINMIMSPDPKYTGIQPYAYIRTKGGIWVLDQEKYNANPAVAEYTKLDEYPTSTVKPMYNMNKSVAELSEEYRTKTNNNEEQASDSQQAPIDDNSYDIAHNSGNDNPEIENVEELLNPASLEEGERTLDYESILNDPNIPNSQTPAGMFNDNAEYNDQNILQDDFCGI